MREARKAFRPYEVNVHLPRKKSTFVSKYETGENDIPTDILIKLANFYGTSIDYLLDQTKNPVRNL